MDFRQCPACQASVLDDDAAECPFCGASMSGKPTAAPAKPAAAAKPSAKPSAKAEPKAAAPQRQTPARRVGETVADEDDPFGIDTSSVAQVPKVAPKPAKGRMIRLQCPMCETPGFISSKMQGKDVKCCNPDCMVPVFKAPLPKKETTEQSTKSGGLTGRTMGIVAGVVLLLGGLLFWGFYLSRQQGTLADQPAQPTYKYDPELIGGNDPAPQATDPATTAPKTITLDEIKRQSLASIVMAAQSREDNRKAFGRRLAAESYAVTGDVAGAQEQLSQLQKRSVGGNAPYFQVEPLVLIAWQQLAKGQKDAAAQLIQQATTAYQKLPPVGREVLTGGVALAAAQAAFDQVPQAKNTLRQLEAEHERAKVAALMHIAIKLGTFDVDELLQLTSLDMSVDPLAVAVAIDTASYGRWQQAIAWANAQDSLASREDCLSALATYAGLHAARTQQTDAAALIQSVSGLSPTGQSRVHAGLATGYLMGGNRSQAEAELAQTVQSFSAIAKPTPVATPTHKQIHDSDAQPNAGLPDASALQSSAVAAMQVARLQSTLGQQEAAWQTLLQAWDFTAGIAPNLTSIHQLVDEFENRRSRAEAKLTQELNLRNDDQKYRARNQYRGQLRVFETAARNRFDLERGLLRDAVTMGFPTEVEQFRKDPAAALAVAAGQPYLQANEDDRLLQAFSQTEEMFAAGQFKQVAETLAGFRDTQNKSNEERRDLRALQLACRLMKTQKVDALLSYVDGLNDPWLTEDALELTAALGVLNGLGPQIWKGHQRHDLQPTEKVALYRGLISGITTKEQQPSRPAQTAAVE